MKNNLLELTILILSLMIFISSCTQVNPSEKIACENSGGQYSKGLSETAGPFYYCKCPVTKYEENKICINITEKEIEMCKELSNEFVDCDNNLGACECVFKDSGTESYIPYAQLMTSDCECDGNGCGCLYVE